MRHQTKKGVDPFLQGIAAGRELVAEFLRDLYAAMDDDQRAVVFGKQRIASARKAGLAMTHRTIDKGRALS